MDAMDRALNDLVKGQDAAKPTVREPGEIAAFSKRVPDLVEEGMKAGAHPIMSIFAMAVVHTTLAWVLGSVSTEKFEALLKAQRPPRS